MMPPKHTLREHLISWCYIVTMIVIGLWAVYAIAKIEDHILTIQQEESDK